MNGFLIGNINTKRISVILLVVIGMVGFSSVSNGNISGTKHDFTFGGDVSGQGYGISSERCSVCHIPHRPGSYASPGPLWNHEVSTAMYSTYSSSTMNAVVAGQPGGTSKLCLSCHDGTIAVDSFGGETDGTKFMTAGSNAYIGTDLSDDHPVSFVYDSALAASDGELYDPATRGSGLGSTIQNDLLSDNNFQCTSCHDAHDNSNGKFLRIANDNSEMCRTCHIK